MTTASDDDEKIPDDAVTAAGGILGDPNATPFEKSEAGALLQKHKEQIEEGDAKHVHDGKDVDE